MSSVYLESVEGECMLCDKKGTHKLTIKRFFKTTNLLVCEKCGKRKFKEVTNGI